MVIPLFRFQNFAAALFGSAGVLIGADVVFGSNLRKIQQQGLDRHAVSEGSAELLETTVAEVWEQRSDEIVVEKEGQLDIEEPRNPNTSTAATPGALETDIESETSVIQSFVINLIVGAIVAIVVIFLQS
jgi:hypothetical protein